MTSRKILDFYRNYDFAIFQNIGIFWGLIGFHVPMGLNCNQMEEGEQYSEHSVERNPRANMSMRDNKNPPWVSAPSYMVPSTNAPYGNAFNLSWGNHTNSSLPQYVPPPHPQSTSPMEEAILNLTKLVGNFVEAQKTINAQLSKKIDTIENNVNKIIDGLQSEMEHKFDNLQDSISRLTNQQHVHQEEVNPE